MAKSKIELAREIALRTKPRFIDIPRDKRVTRSTAMDNHIAKYGPITPIEVPDGPPLTAKRLMSLRRYPTVSALLQQEQERLIRTWSLK